MSYSCSNNNQGPHHHHYYPTVPYGISSETALGSCAPRINARTGGYDMPLPFEEEQSTVTSFVTDTSTVKVDNTTTATSKEFLRLRLSDRRQRRKGVERSSSSTRSSNFWRTESFDSDVIDQKLRSRVPRLLQGRLRRFNLIRKFETSGRTELVSEDEDDDDDDDDSFAAEEDEVVSVRPRQCFVLPDESPLPSTPVRKPFLGAQRNRTVSSSSDSVGFEVVTQGNDAVHVSPMIVDSSSQHALAGQDDTTEESDDTTTCFSGFGSSMVSDSRLMNSSEPGALRLTTGSLQHHDQRFGVKAKTTVPRQRRRFPFLRKSGVPDEENPPPPMDSKEQQRIERKRQQYLAQQRERELARVSREQRDRVFNSIIGGKSAAERQDIWKDILDEAKARGKYTLNCSAGYAPHMDRSTSIATAAVQCGGAECPAPLVFHFSK